GSAWNPVRSGPRKAGRLPSGENAALLTVLVCPLRVRASCPVRASHTLTSPQDFWVLSSKPPPAEAIRLPSGENATLQTSPVCPLRVRASCPVCPSHTLTACPPLTPASP